MNNAKRDKRLKILTNTEKQTIYSIPNFSPEEQKFFFKLDSTELSTFNAQRGINSKIHFILLLGYFRAVFRLFVLDEQNVKSDIAYILHAYLPERTQEVVSFKNRKIHNSHRKIILRLHGFMEANRQILQSLLSKAEGLFLQDSNPRYIFQELHQYLNRRKVILPAYSTMQKLISQAIFNQENLLAQLIKDNLTESIRNQLDALLSKETESRYQLTLIKAPAAGFTYKKALKERKKQEQIREIYGHADAVITQIGISNFSVKYYARLVDQYTIQQINQFEDNKKYFLLFCFVYYKYRKINDILIKTLLHHIGKHKTDVKEAAQEKAAEIRLSHHNNLEKGARIFELLISETIPDEISVQDFREQTYSILPRDEIAGLAGYMKSQRIDYESLKWSCYDEKKRVMRMNIRPLFQAIQFSSSENQKIQPLMEAVQYMKDIIFHNKRKMNDVPERFISTRNLKFIIQNDQVITSRYEQFLYNQLKARIDSSDIFIPDSIDYRSFESELIPMSHYSENRKQLYSDIGLPFLLEDFEDRLQSKLNLLDSLIRTVNYNIKSQTNHCFKFQNNPKRSWSIEYSGVENEDVNNPIFKKIPKIDLPDLIFYSHQATNCLCAFSHILNRNAKLKPVLEKIIGVIIAFGTNMGLTKMASCSNLSYSEMKSVKDSFFREETLQGANDILVNATSKMPVQKIFNINNKVHSSIDGKKYDAKTNIFNARYSPKYFNMGKGISVLTLVINHQPVGLKIISPNEYEGNFSLELLLMNETELQSEINSTDMHGINDINFAVHGFLGCAFHPRYSDLYVAAQSIVCSSSFGDIPDDFIIKPNGQVNSDHIISEADNIKRIVCSIATKKCSISNLVKKMSLSLKSNSTRKAIAEYNKIDRSIHILRSINDLKYRQNITQALNRGEAYHQLTGAVGYANNGKIIAKTELDQIIFKECTRLLCNMIIYYNTSILNDFYLKKLEQGQHNQIKAIGSISPVSWVNYNLYGRFDISSRRTKLSHPVNLEDEILIPDDFA